MGRFGEGVDGGAGGVGGAGPCEFVLRGGVPGDVRGQCGVHSGVGGAGAQGGADFVHLAFGDYVECGECLLGFGGVGNRGA